MLKTSLATTRDLVLKVYLWGRGNSERQVPALHDQMGLWMCPTALMKSGVKPPKRPFVAPTTLDHHEAPLLVRAAAAAFLAVTPGRWTNSVRLFLTSAERKELRIASCSVLRIDLTLPLELTNHTLLFLPTTKKGWPLRFIAPIT